MAKVFLPDNTVLINFAIIGRVDLLADLLGGHGCWRTSIARESRNSQRYHPALAAAPAIFGTPLIPDPTELADTQVLRTSMARPGDQPTKHLGEAETVAIINRRGLKALFLTDDKAAKALAAHHGITAVTTWDLLRLAHRAGKVTTTDLSGYVRTLRANRRGTPPGVTDPNQLAPWLS